MTQEFPKGGARVAAGARLWIGVAALLLTGAVSRPAAAADTMYFPAVDNVTTQIVNAINNENVRIDISAWYLTEHSISIALANKHAAGVPIRLIGDRGSIFEIDPNTKREFYFLANAGVPIRLRYNPSWFPEIDHWKVGIFKGQNLVEFGSPNWTPFELAPSSSTNYDDETALFTTDPVLVNAFLTKFDVMWNDTTTEPESVISGPPYLKNWYDACALETACSDFSTTYANPAPMTINTARLEPNNSMPADLIWGQGPDFNNRLVTEINNESSRIRFVIYRLTVDNITQALLSKFQSGVPMQLIVEPNEYLNKKWPEFWLTHANIDRLWAAGVPIKQRAHQGLTHMKMLVTSSYATNASSNYAANWQRDTDYFVSASGKPTIYSAMLNRFDTMWNDSTGFATFVPQPPDPAVQASPASGATSVATNTPLVWNAAAFATSYDVYLGTSQSSMSLVGNVPAQLVQNPPSTYSWTPSSALATGTTYYWQIVSKTNATVKNSSLVAYSAVSSFTTSGTASGGGGGGGGTSNVPSPWSSNDVGSTGLAGWATYSSGVFTVNGSGADIWGSADSFQYVSQPLSGDGTMIARVTGEQAADSYAKAGIMLRETTASNAADVIIDVRPGGSIEFMSRPSDGSATNYIAGATQSLPAWLKLVRSGSTVTGYVSSNGSTWTQVGSATVTMASSALAGLAVTSHNTSAMNTSTFDNVSVTAGSTGGGGGGGGGTGGAVPSPWVDQDVGSTGLTGSATYSSPTFTVKGSGADIWGAADSFNFLYQPLSGDGTIVARVTSEQATDTYAKAGVMLRETTASSAADVILDVRPGGSIEFMSRPADGGSTSYIAGATQTLPAWLKLVRSGSTVTGFVSADGSSWTQVGTATVTMTTAAVAGMAVTSHNTSAINTSTFDNVSVTAGSTTGGGGGGGGGGTTTATNVVVYASDVASSSMNGSWNKGSDPSSPNGIKLVTPDNGVANTSNALASPTDYVDVTFNAVAGTPYTFWMRMEALNNSKYNDSLWVQFSDAQVGGSTAYAINSTSGLLVNLATGGSGSSLSNWGWQNKAYWLTQATTVTFPTTGTHTLRIQVREDGVQFDQIVLSPTTYLNSAPGPVNNDATIVPKP